MAKASGSDWGAQETSFREKKNRAKKVEANQENLRPSGHKDRDEAHLFRRSLGRFVQRKRKRKINCEKEKGEENKT